DTKTEKSRRTLRLPTQAAEVLKAHKARQAAERLKTGELWEEHNLVFCTSVGTPLDAANVRRGFRQVVTAAKVEGAWTPRELRHSFVSLLSANGTSVEAIADLLGHAGTRVTEAVYRHELRPVLTEGAEVIDTIFGKRSAS
ncbi:MAG: tyrosine-type recombinase/integrase, partial [Actinophytocola sp.]|nr:tyrosine-type recombinase/integrase [Actinophytocola sp.]